MQAASLLDGFSFDLFPPFENGLTAPEVDVSRRQVVQALVVSTVVVVLDELLDALFELSWQVVVLQQDPVFHRAVISLDLALGHRVVRPAADMSDAVVIEPGRGRGSRGYEKTRSHRHLRRSARRAISADADRRRVRLSERHRRGLEWTVRARRRAAANCGPHLRRHGEGARHARRQGCNFSPGLEGGQQRQPASLRALHQSGSGKIPPRHQGRRPRRLAVAGLTRHARPCAGHPRLVLLDDVKTWMAGTSPAMTAWMDQLRPAVAVVAPVSAVKTTHRFGLLTPSPNTVQEPEFSALPPRTVSVHTARVAYRDITPQEQDRCVLELESESRKLADAEVDVIVFAATAPTLAKGKGYDRELIKRMEDASGRPATTAATAFVDALTRLGVERIAIGAPWSKTMDKPMVDFMELSGFKVVPSEVVGFVASIELGRVGPERAYELGRCADRPDADAVIMPGGNWPAMSVVERLERELGKPVLANNAVSLWAGLRLLKTRDHIPGYGRLLRDHLPH